MDYTIIPKYPQGEARREESQLFNWLDNNISNRKEYVEIEKICSFLNVKLIKGVEYLTKNELINTKRAGKHSGSRLYRTQIV